MYRASNPALRKAKGAGTMAIDKEFLGRLDREIASLKERRAQIATDANALRKVEAQVKKLEEMRQNIITQSTGS
jgi:hypothetical protein